MNESSSLSAPTGPSPPGGWVGMERQPWLPGAPQAPPLVRRPSPRVIFPENVGFALYPPT